MGGGHPINQTMNELMLEIFSLSPPPPERREWIKMELITDHAFTRKTPQNHSSTGLRELPSG